MTKNPNQGGPALIKFSFLSAPKKVGELEAGSDEKTQRSPAGNRTHGLASCHFTSCVSLQWIPFLMFFFLFEKIKSPACPILFKFSGEPCYGLIYSPLY